MTHPTKHDYLTAGRASRIPKASAWLWYIRKIEITKVDTVLKGITLPEGIYTTLHRITDKTIEKGGMGETVMSDEPGELRKHLAAAMSARGSVLVTGLGLGCVLRMLQVNPRVTSITLIERDPHVIKLVWPYTSHDRVELVRDEAESFLARTKRRWDCAWHDVWTDESKGEVSLAVKHTRMMAACIDRVGFQGAWNYPRKFSRSLNAIKRRMVCECVPS